MLVHLLIFFFFFGKVSLGDFSSISFDNEH
jgi:hypothetical protein